MAINISYGPIGAALGLAQVAGAGQGYNTQAERDLQALQIQNQMQRTANDYATNTVQNGIAQQRLNSGDQLQQQQMAIQAAEQQARLQMEAKNQNLQQSQFAEQQKTREEQAKSLADERAQRAAGQKQQQDIFNRLTPDQQNIAAYPSLKPNTASNSSELTDERSRGGKLLDIAENEYRRAQAQFDKLDGDPLADPARVKQLRLTIDGIDPSTGQQMVPSEQTLKGKRDAALRAYQGGSAPSAAGGAPAQANPGQSPQINPLWIEKARQAVGSDPQAILAWIKQNIQQLRAQPSQPIAPVSATPQQLQPQSYQSSMQQPFQQNVQY